LCDALYFHSDAHDLPLAVWVFGSWRLQGPVQSFMKKANARTPHARAPSASWPRLFGPFGMRLPPSFLSYERRRRKSLSPEDTISPILILERGGLPGASF